MYKSKQAVPKETHETVEEAHERDNGVIPDGVSRIAGDDNANEAEQAQAGESE